MSKNKLITHILNEDEESFKKDSLQMINELTIFGFDPFKDNLLDFGVQKADKWIAKTANVLINRFINMFTKEGRLSNKMEKLRDQYLKQLEILEKQKANAIKEATKSRNYKDLKDIEEKNDIVKNINDEIESCKFYIEAASRYIKARKKIFGSSYGDVDDENSKISSQMKEKLKEEDDRVSQLTKEILELEIMVKTGSASNKVSGLTKKLEKKREELSKLLGIPMGSATSAGGGSAR